MDQTSHSLIDDHVQLPILYMPVDTIYAVLCQALIRHLVGGLKHNISDAAALATQSFLTIASFCRKPQEIVIKHSLFTTTSLIRLGMIRLDKILPILGSCDSIDPRRPAAFRPEFGREHPINLPVWVSRVEERYKLFASVAKCM